MLSTPCAESTLARQMPLSGKAIAVGRAAAIFFLLAMLIHRGLATAAELKVFTSRAIATVLDKIGPEFERTSGHKLNVISGFSPNFVKQINAGEAFDIVVSPPRTIDGLIKDGKVIAGTRTNLVRSGLGIAVRAGAPKPDITSVEAFKRALLNANRLPTCQPARHGKASTGLELLIPSSRK